MANIVKAKTARSTYTPRITPESCSKLFPGPCQVGHGLQILDTGEPFVLFSALFPKEITWLLPGYRTQEETRASRNSMRYECILAISVRAEKAALLGPHEETQKSSNEKAHECMDLGFTLTLRECLNLFIAVSYEQRRPWPFSFYCWCQQSDSLFHIVLQ